MTEAQIIRAESLRLSPDGWRIWRVVPGKLWKGFYVKKTTYVRKNGTIGPAVVLGDPTPMELFPVGEPDSHLTRPVVITPDMIGSIIRQFGKAEVKTTRYKTVTNAQRENLRATARMGGVAYVWREQPDGSILWEEVTG